MDLTNRIIEVFVDNFDDLPRVLSSNNQLFFVLIKWTRVTYDGTFSSKCLTNVAHNHMDNIEIRIYLL